MAPLLRAALSLVAVPAVRGVVFSESGPARKAKAETKPNQSPLRFRRGLETDSFKKGSGFDFLRLPEVIAKVRESLPGQTFGSKPTLVNVGASYKDEDPIYSMTLADNFQSDYVILGYDCSHGKILHEKRPDVTFRSMCVTGPTIIADMKTMNVPNQFAMLKTDIDSLDGPVLDAILQTYSPYVVYSEILWDFPPPIEFSLVKVGPQGFNGRNGGCFGMSLQMAHHILQRNGYVLIEAAHANIMAVHKSVAHLFADRPTDPWFWWQTVKSALYHTHFLGAGVIHAKNATPMSFLSSNLGLYETTLDNRHSMDAVMSNVGKRLVAGCNMAHGENYVLAVGDRCCAPEWGDLDGCVCEFLEKDKGEGLRSE